MATFEGNIVQRSAKAICFWCHYWWAPIWLPVSQSTIVEDGEGYVVHVKDWLCKKRDMQEFTEYTEKDIERMNDG